MRPSVLQRLIRVVSYARLTQAHWGARACMTAEEKTVVHCANTRCHEGATVCQTSHWELSSTGHTHRLNQSGSSSWNDWSKHSCLMLCLYSRMVYHCTYFLHFRSYASGLSSNMCMYLIKPFCIALYSLTPSSSVLPPTLSYCLRPSLSPPFLHSSLLLSPSHFPFSLSPHLNCKGGSVYLTNWVNWY